MENMYPAKPKSATVLGVLGIIYASYSLFSLLLVFIFVIISKFISEDSILSIFTFAFSNVNVFYYAAIFIQLIIDILILTFSIQLIKVKPRSRKRLELSFWAMIPASLFGMIVGIFTSYDMINSDFYNRLFGKIDRGINDFSFSESYIATQRAAIIISTIIGLLIAGAIIALFIIFLRNKKLVSFFNTLEK